MTVEPKLLQFEQHLYLRQPGYGTSYVTGKYLMEQLLAERSQQQAARGAAYSLYDFFTEFQAAYESITLALPAHLRELAAITEAK